MSEPAWVLEELRERIAGLKAALKSEEEKAETWRKAAYQGAELAKGYRAALQNIDTLSFDTLSYSKGQIVHAIRAELSVLNQGSLVIPCNERVDTNSGQTSGQDDPELAELEKLDWKPSRQDGSQHPDGHCAQCGSWQNCEHASQAPQGAYISDPTRMPPEPTSDDAMEKALMDAAVYGKGAVHLDKDLNATHVPYSEPTSDDSKGWPLDSMKVWSCGHDHGAYLIDPKIENVLCPCGKPAVPYAEWVKMQASKELKP